MPRKRPAGEKHDVAYQGSEKWGKNRWAWEFLRRNPKFMKACKDVDQGTRLESDVARLFGLSAFKHCKEPYKGPNRKVPKFLGSIVTSRARLQEGDSKRYARDLAVGELVMVLRLEPCLYSTTSLDSQLRAGRRAAIRNLEQLAAFRSLELRSGRVTQRQQWPDYLRILDALASDKTHYEVAQLVYPNQFGAGATRDDWVTFVRERIERARSMASSRYLDIAFSPPGGSKK